MDQSLKFLRQDLARMRRMWVRIADTSQSAERHSLSVLVPNKRRSHPKRWRLQKTISGPSVF
jgi:hypothetical protein